MFYRSFPENVTIRDKYNVTRKFTAARDKNPYFYLGPLLLRSARSSADESAFILEDEVSSVTAPIP